MTAAQHTGRFAWATYASFSNNRGSGGWQVGAGSELSPSEKDLFTSLAPTQLEPITPVTEFLSTEEIRDLPRRFVYLAPQQNRQVGLYVQSVPAGKDATGRPGNVFSVGVVDRAPEAPLEQEGWPIFRYQSPDFPTPFRSEAVDSVAVGGGAEPRTNEDDQLNAAWSLINGMLGDDRPVLYALQQALEDSDRLPVISSRSTWDAVLWMTALSTTMPPGLARQQLSFSVFERAQRLDVDAWLQRGPAVVAVPFEDKDALRDPRLVVIDPNEIRTPPEEGLWSALTEAVFDSKDDTLEIINGLNRLQPEEEEPSPEGAPHELEVGEALYQALEKLSKDETFPLAKDLATRLAAIPQELRSLAPEPEPEPAPEPSPIPEQTPVPEPRQEPASESDEGGWGAQPEHTRDVTHGAQPSEPIAQRQSWDSWRLDEAPGPAAERRMGSVPEPHLARASREENPTDARPRPVRTPIPAPREEKPDARLAEFQGRWRPMVRVFPESGSDNVLRTAHLLSEENLRTLREDSRLLATESHPLPFAGEELKSLFSIFFSAALRVHAGQLKLDEQEKEQLLQEMLPAIGRLWAGCLQLEKGLSTRLSIKTRAHILAQGLYENYLSPIENLDGILGRLGPFIAKCDRSAPGDRHELTHFYLLEHELRECHREKQERHRSGYPADLGAGRTAPATDVAGG